MSKREFLRTYRDELTDAAKAWGLSSVNDSDRWDVVLNDEGWYRMARRAGVRV